MSAFILSTLLTELNAMSEDIDASAIISVDGLMIASVFPMALNAERTSALTAAMHALGGRLVQDLKRGKLEQVLIKGGDGYVLMTHIGNKAILTVMVKPKAKLGLIFLDIKRVVNKISELL